MLGKSFREGTIVTLVHNGFLGSQGFAERRLYAFCGISGLHRFFDLSQLRLSGMWSL